VQIKRLDSPTLSTLSSEKSPTFSSLCDDGETIVTQSSASDSGYTTVDGNERESNEDLQSGKDEIVCSNFETDNSLNRVENWSAVPGQSGDEAPWSSSVEDDVMSNKSTSNDAGSSVREETLFIFEGQSKTAAIYDY
jgi:hypothetical protein